MTDQDTPYRDEPYPEEFDSGRFENPLDALPYVDPKEAIGTPARRPEDDEPELEDLLEEHPPLSEEDLQPDIPDEPVVHLPAKQPDPSEEPNPGKPGESVPGKQERKATDFPG